jgi:hypothetical protein
MTKDNWKHAPPDEENGLERQKTKDEKQPPKDITLWWCLNFQPATNKASIGRNTALGLRHMAGLSPPSPSVNSGVMSAIRPRLAFVKRCDAKGVFDLAEKSPTLRGAINEDYLEATSLMSSTQFTASAYLLSVKTEGE